MHWLAIKTYSGKRHKRHPSHFPPDLTFRSASASPISLAELHPHSVDKVHIVSKPDAGRRGIICRCPTGRRTRVRFVCPHPITMEFTLAFVLVFTITAECHVVVWLMSEEHPMLNSHASNTKKLSRLTQLLSYFTLLVIHQLAQSYLIKIKKSFREDIASKVKYLYFNLINHNNFLFNLSSNTTHYGLQLLQTTFLCISWFLAFWHSTTLISPQNLSLCIKSHN